MAASDAETYSVADNDLVEITSRRGRVRARARIGAIAAGHLFIPFHYGYLDVRMAIHACCQRVDAHRLGSISKQPHFKFAAVRIQKIGG